MGRIAYVVGDALVAAFSVVMLGVLLDDIPHVSLTEQDHLVTRDFPDGPWTTPVVGLSDMLSPIAR